MKEKTVRKRVIKDQVFKIVIFLFGITSSIPLLLIIYYILRKGIKVINWKFLVSLPKPVGEGGGGILNAIVGSILIILVASVFAIPIGILAGTFLSENRESRISNVIRVLVDVLQGTPSIVIGVIAYIWVVKPMGGFSGFAGGVALAFIMLPMIVRTTEEVLNLVPKEIKEASLALGVSYHRTILKVIIPSGFSGIITGILLGIARISGETAPLLFTAFGNQFLTLNIFKPISSIPLLIFVYAMSPFDEWHQIAWGASLILLVLVLTLNILGRYLGRLWKVKF